MHNLVAEHRRELGFRAELGHEAPVYGDLAARQCPGIGNGVIEDHELVRQVHFAGRGQLIAERLHVASELRVDVVAATLGLLHGHVVLLAHLDFFSAADEHQVAFASDGVDGTTGET